MLLRSAGIALLVGAAFLVQAANAQSGRYTWTGYGRGTVDSPNCGRYKMTVNVTAENGRAIGRFQQEGRPERTFNAPLQPNGVFKGEATVGDGNKMQVTGRLSGDSGEILLDGYCKFGGSLRRA